MSKSISHVVLHLVFVTKFRQPFILPQVEKDLYAYIITVCENVQCEVIAIGGYYEHIHILCFLSRKIAIMKLAEKVKSNSSRWIKSRADFLKDFEWQEGYAVFSARVKDIPQLKTYILNQKSHHKEMEFSHNNQNFIRIHSNEPLRATSDVQPL